jgi:methanogenic corrinoid protein MtbC1
VTDIQAVLVEAIRRADRSGALAALDAWGEEHGHDRVVPEVLEPALARVGEEWSSAEAFTVAQVYVAGKIAGDALLRLARRGPARAPMKGAVVIGNVEDDFHALGRKILGTFLATDGFEVHDLGNDVAPADFVDAAVATGARVVGVSAMMLGTARRIGEVRAEIERRGLGGRLQLAVGGAVFVARPELVREVGGDGTAPNALRGPALFDALATRSRAAEAAS